MSNELQRFPDQEENARKKSFEEHRRNHFARLSTLLLGEKASSLAIPAERYRQAARLPPPRGKNPLRRTLGLLFGQATPCSLETLENSLFSAIFDLPPVWDSNNVGANFHLPAEVERRYRERRKELGALEAVYRALRPENPEAAFTYVDALMARLATDGANGPASDRQRLVQSLQQYLRTIAEPIRIQTYLRAKVVELEGALRATIPGRATAKLFAAAERELYRNETALWRLEMTPPEQVVTRLEPLVNRWFHRHALPAVQKALARDPFAAYWFFVQTGGVARGPVPFNGSRVRVVPETLALDSLKNLSLPEALAQLAHKRIPSAFVQAHALLEQAFTDFTLTREDAVGHVSTVELEPRQRDKPCRFLETPHNPARLSTLDFYAQLVHDANQIGGRADWEQVRGGLALLTQAKRSRLQEVIAVLVSNGAANGDPAPLRRYLEIAGELLLELEQRQATERRFQEATGGGLTRWVLRDLLMSPGVPTQLWAPEGVTGNEFAELLDKIGPKNRQSGNRYHGKPTSEIRLVHDGREFRESVIEVIDTADSFLNIASFDWKLDPGGKEIAYRLMAKKLGIEGPAYERFLAAFSPSLTLEPNTLFYDIPPRYMKNLLVYFFFRTSDLPAIAEAHRLLENRLGGELTCPTVLSCGDLASLKTRAGENYDRRRATEPDYQETWEVYRSLQALFEGKPAELDRVRSRAALADYVAEGEDLRRFVRLYGRKRADDPTTPFPINILVDGKQNLFNVDFGRSREFPYFLSDPFWNIYVPLYEFDARLLFWKGVLEFPWHAGPLPLPGRKIFGVFPMPYLPYPWLGLVPGFGWAGIGGSLFLQHLLATDVRAWWAMAMHAKNVSSESKAIESGMGMGTKYFNVYPEFSTWHDMGVKVQGPIVGDVNDHFVQLFNTARVNNAGVPRSRQVNLPRLQYEDYCYAGPRDPGPRAWVVTTYPEKADYNYRGVFMAALAAARKNIYLENSFFTDPLVARMLMHKAQEFSGRVNCAELSDFDCADKKRQAVEIYLVLPDASDKPILDVVGQADLFEMLHLGVKIYRWNPPRGWSASKMLHSKVWLIDYEPSQPSLVYVGSANATQRSHLTDNEIGILSTSPEFAGEVYEKVFRHDLTTDARPESRASFHTPWSARQLTRSGRWFRSLLVNLLWFF
ncbi:MAG: phosphatidylserine/phosphatidylglycerophosphate/cardiolipin synthase family protein [Acidobacteria bacterium]|nr:phosphatidylserine/phosphatidylglycerophosphate/cardiolipin synthase family protein [Acidobacteriota bacterium]